MTNTQRKLDEARFFLSKLDIDDPYFDYFLSAYLNAARSVTWIMRNEYGKLAGWKEWFADYSIPDIQMKIFAEINNLRVNSTKQTGVKTDYFLFQSDMFIDESQYSMLEKFFNQPDGEYILSIEPIDNKSDLPKDPDSLSFIGTIDRTRTSLEKSRESILDLCKEYYSIILTVVNNCSENFKLT